MWAPRGVITMSLKAPAGRSKATASNSLPNCPGFTQPRSACGVFSADLQSDFSRQVAANLLARSLGFPACSLSSRSKSSRSASACVLPAGAGRRACASVSPWPASFSNKWAIRMRAGFPGSLPPGPKASPALRFLESGCLDDCVPAVAASLPVPWVPPATLMCMVITPAASSGAAAGASASTRRHVARGRSRWRATISPSRASPTPRTPSVRSMRHEVPASNCSSSSAISVPMSCLGRFMSRKPRARVTPALRSPGGIQIAGATGRAAASATSARILNPRAACSGLTAASWEITAR
mmetsp:Transcript_30811/g.98203  ORF Transcript_30811/g.98203 Transcript_30811/m.98203 type:complete len:296 (+) Transcript_30811:126-1013(+)